MSIHELAIEQTNANPCELSPEQLQAISPEAIEQLQSSVSLGLMVVGHRAAGKGTFGTFMADEGFLTGATSAALRTVIRQNGIEETPYNLMHYGHVLKDTYGPNVLTYLTCADILHSQQPDRRHNILLDGPRTIEEVRGFRAILPENHLVVAITSDPQSIWYRHEQRRRQTGRVDFQSYQDYLDHIQGDEYLRIEDLIQHHADMAIDNSVDGAEGLAQLQQRAHSLAARFGKIW
ncbi:MAG: hypothetical protein NUV52_03165 [Candidatus Roizmanbacteria bacterium]|nr:hypothetical protein [Candidatus Roizmanbacteria bacterium]